MFRFTTPSAKKWTRNRHGFLVLATLAVSLSLKAFGASTWYVDSAATGTQSGTSWANAWTSLSQLTAVKAGDTVYISGGPAGSSRSYSYSGNFPIVNGSGNTARTIYQIGPAPNYNGTAYINLNGNHLLTEVNNVNFIGDAGDGLRHIVLTNCNECVSIYAANGQNWKLSYVDMGASAIGLNVNVENNSEIDHCKFVKLMNSNSSYTHVYGFQSYVSPSWPSSGYGSNSFHHNLIFMPRSGQSSPDGDDCLDSGNGLDFYNNVIVAYYTSGYPSGIQHQDGCQWEWGGYFRCYNNVFVNMANSAFYIEGGVGNVSHARWYNNIVIGDNSSICGSPMRGIDINSGSTPTFTDIVVANNIFADLGNSAHPAAWAIRVGQDNATYNSVIVANNVSLWGSGLGGYGGANGTNNWAANNVGQLTWTSGTGHYVAYTAFAGTNNNYHLVTGDTTFIGQGTNLTALGITTDMDGNPRPATGAWDIGPYKFGTGGTLTMNAGPDMTTMLPTNSVTLNGSYTNTIGGTVSVSWSMVSGPGTVNFSAPNSTATTATFSVAGVYVLRLTGVVQGTTATDDVQVTVLNSASTPPPTVTIGPVVNGAIVSNMVSLTATATNSSGGASVTSLSMLLDGAAIGQSASSPFKLFWNSQGTANGSHRVQAIAQDAIGNQGTSAVITLTVQNQTSTTVTNMLVANAAVTAPFTVSGGILSQSVETTVTNGGTAQFGFSLPSSGSFVVNALINAPGTNSNSFYVNFDTTPTDPTMVWDTPVTSGFENHLVCWRGNGTPDSDQYSPKVFSLSAGPHTLIIVGREAGVGLQSVQIQNVTGIPLPPTGLYPY